MEDYSITQLSHNCGVLVDKWYKKPVIGVIDTYTKISWYLGGDSPLISCCPYCKLRLIQHLNELNICPL